MSQTVTAVPKKPRRPRSPSVARPAFIILQLLDEDDEPMAFDKKRVKIVAVERSAEKVMEAMEDGMHPHAFYLRVIVPVGARASVARKEPAAAA